MPVETRNGATYRRKLPHFRTPGSIYHVRFSVFDRKRYFHCDGVFEEVERSLFYFHRSKLLLHAYVIMPNHVHSVLEPLPITLKSPRWSDYRNFHSLERIIKSVKGYTSREINKRLGTSGPLWRDEYFDRTIRGEKDLMEVIDYIHHNPVRWTLVQSPAEYRWSSAHTIYSGKAEYAGWFNWGS
jgi:REP element-mobilizing transposase RayT